MTTTRNRSYGQETLVMILLLFVAFVSAAFVGGALFLSLNTPPPQPIVEPPAPPDYQIPTAREAYIPAIEFAREADPAAELASAAAAWSAGTPYDQLRSGRSGWTFHFFLPNSRDMLTIVVNRGGEPQLINREGWLTTPVLLPDQFWQIDSSRAAEVFTDSCPVEENPQADAHLRLTTAATNGGIVWVSQLRDGDAILCTTRLDATTGEILDTQ